MQTVVWMAYLDSTHFSDKFSYKILFILSYHLKDINFASFAYLQEFLEKTENDRRGTQPGSLTGGAEGMTRR
jgi:hypothetical protein